ncbi:hypothetical protein GBA52_023538 [Prunus armeniaca]|nr:hypothetical protein GBA52_023538 [Prunus armeniaca]
MNHEIPDKTHDYVILLLMDETAPQRNLTAPDLRIAHHVSYKSFTDALSVEWLEDWTRMGLSLGNYKF